MLLSLGARSQTTVMQPYGNTIDLNSVYEPIITGTYVAKYYFNGFKKFVLSSTDSVTEGTTNLFFTTARAVAAAGTSFWKVTGNSGTVAGTNFIGTTDAQQFRIRTNNAERLIIDTLGNIAINSTINPSYRFYLTGNSYSFGTSTFQGPGGLADLIANGNAIRGTGSGTSASMYIDGSTDLSGTINMRANSVSMGALSTSTITNGGNVNAASSSLTAGYGFQLGGNYILNVDNGGTILRVNDNTILKTIFTKATNTVLTDQGTTVNGFVPQSSALLDMESTTKGLLIPSMTTTQKNAIATPATGLQVYDLTMKCICTYNGTSWTNQPTTSTGTAAPTTTPTKIGDQYVDTTNKKIYFATGTTASTDWTIVN